MLGTLYCVLSAIAYTAYNACLRDVSNHYDPAWINCVQASVGASVFGVCLLWRAAHGRRALPPWRELIALAVIGFVTQLGGVLLICSMAVVGVAVSATLQMGVMLAGSAVLGLLVLGEAVSWRQIAAIAMITVSVVVFSRGAQTAGETASTPAVGEDGAAMVAQTDNKAVVAQTDNIAPSPAGSDASGEKDAGGDKSPVRIVLGILAGVLAGIAFAVLTVGIRKVVGGDTSAEAVVFLINAMGVVVFGPWCLYYLGPETLAQTRAGDLGVMLSAGVMNLLGFLLITKSLQMLTVVRVNVVNNAVTMVLTVLVGITLFREPWNLELGLGILLAAAGTLLISMTSAGENDLDPLEVPASTQ